MCAGGDGVLHNSRLKIRTSVVAELYETFNDCRKDLQSQGNHANPLKMKVAPDFFIAEQHMDWRNAFNTARALLEDNFFHAHPMLIKVNELMHRTCSSLSFFRHMEDESFPIDQELFSQIQKCKSGSLVRIAKVESLSLCFSCLSSPQPSSSNPICGRGRTVAFGGPSARDLQLSPRACVGGTALAQQFHDVRSESNGPAPRKTPLQDS